jgi:uncharacterized membrane protein YccF (DUF307 family)
MIKKARPTEPNLPHVRNTGLAVTIIGISLAMANLKLIPVSLVPLGRIIVPTDAAQATRYPMVR